jgi:hypothetical protein
VTDSLSLALHRWYASSRSAEELAPGYVRQLGPFLAGWFCREMGASEPAHLGTARDSFRAGWRECEGQMRIAAREVAHAFVASPDGCRACGLAEYANCHRENA